MTKTFVCIVASSLILTSCASMKTNTFIGASIGAAAGGIGGTAIGSPHDSLTGALIGTATGAALGALIGYITEPKKEKTVEVSGALSGSDNDVPPMLSPKVQRVWQPDKIEDGGHRYEKGHFIYLIERGTVWSMP